MKRMYKQRKYGADRWLSKVKTPMSSDNFVIKVKKRDLVKSFSGRQYMKEAYHLLVFYYRDHGDNPKNPFHGKPVICSQGYHEIELGDPILMDYRSGHISFFARKYEKSPWMFFKGEIGDEKPGMELDEIVGRFNHNSRCMPDLQSSCILELGNRILKRGYLKQNAILLENSMR